MTRAWLVVSLLSLSARGADFALLPPGTFHAAEVKKPGQGWLGLFGDRLAAVTVRATRVRDPVLDDGKPEAVRSALQVEIEGEAQPLVLLKGLPPRALSPLFTDEPPAVASPGTVKLGDATLATELDGERRRLVLTVGQTQQTLWEQDGGDTDGWALRWAGDLDGDGRLDLLLTADRHYNRSTLRLFLSSKAAKGALVREVAKFGATGC